MKVVSNPQKLSKLLKVFSKKGKSIGFVPTMGALHAGHLSLICQARKENNIVVVSIFVNPKQFGAKEDLNKYPRPLKLDLALCRKAGVDLVFLPTAQAMYPEGFNTFVNVEKLSGLLCGVSRPGHFRGVATVIAKFLNIISPDALYLGQKDAQQAVVLKRMISDLNFPVKVKIMPTVREKNGLAISSRNVYLNKEEFQMAAVLWETLNEAKELIAEGKGDFSQIVWRMRKTILKKGPFVIEYISMVNLEDLGPVNKTTRNILVALAVRINKTRLIDNLVVRK
jgi:pantoate--beta-alanine ligase